MNVDRNEGDRPRFSLLTRAYLASAVVIAAAALLIAVTPVTISAPITGDQLLIVLTGAGILLLANLWLLRRVLGPVERLTRLVARVDPSEPEARIPEAIAHSPEVGALARAFNDLLDRLEHERRDTSRVALAAQEGERKRVAQELHDEVGQSLTAAAIRIERMAGDQLGSATELREVAGAVRDSLDDVRRIARELRPDVLDDLGLMNALISLCSRVAAQSGLRIKRELSPVSRLTKDDELVIYRVAQECLTNVVRHAEATTARVALRSDDDDVTLVVADDGRGLPSPLPRGTAGISGMRERARLVRGSLEIESEPGKGTMITLVVPLELDEDGRPA